MGWHQLIIWQRLLVWCTGSNRLFLRHSSSCYPYLIGLINHHQHFVCCVWFGCIGNKARGGMCVCVCLSGPLSLGLKNIGIFARIQIMSSFPMYQKAPPINSPSCLSVCIVHTRYVCVSVCGSVVGDRCLLIQQDSQPNLADRKMPRRRLWWQPALNFFFSLFQLLLLLLHLLVHTHESNTVWLHQHHFSWALFANLFSLLQAPLTQLSQNTLSSANSSAYDK